MPHEVTYSRVLGEAVNVEEFEQVVSEFWNQEAHLSVLINIDGKALRGTIPTGKTQGVHLLAAYMPEEGIVLMQMEVEKKENEIVVAPKLLKCLDLEGRIVTGDAMFAQRKLSIQIAEAGGDYIWTVKANQASLLGDIVRLFEPASCPAGTSPMHNDFRTAKTIDTGHGRVETRTITTSSMLDDYSDWPYLGQVFKLERKVLHLSTGKETFEVAYGVTSLSAAQASPKQLLRLTRRHWAIENELHYPRDVTFNEDRCRLKIGHAARSMAIINNLVIGLIKQLDFQYMPQARRFFNAHSDAALDLVLCA
jgi:predicted transposase YbfD/YdcC